MNNPADNLNETQSDVGEQSSHTMENLQQRAKQTWETVQDQTGRTMQEGATYVRENPVPVLIGALFLGLTLGLLSGHREPTFRERYIDEPLHESHGILLGALVALGALFRNFFKSASSNAETLAHRFSDVDLKGSAESLGKAAKSAGKKAGWM
ncbi:MAG: hypothetical protein JWL59_4617 [Chthoniobacteraceae bacterium]|nr:hypothetical protein [Chthoniobacteraceae bacterium]